MGDYRLLGVLGVNLLISTGGYSSAHLMSVGDYWLLGVLGVFYALLLDAVQLTSHQWVIIGC